MSKPRIFFKKELRHFKVIIKPYFQAKKQKRVNPKKATLHRAEGRTDGWTDGGMDRAEFIGPSDRARGSIKSLSTKKNQQNHNPKKLLKQNSY